MVNCKIINCNSRARINGFCCRHNTYNSDDVIPEKSKRIVGKKYIYFGKKREWDGKKFLILCDKCDFKVDNMKDYKTHYISNHTEKKDIEWFHCDQENCNYKAKLKTTLKNHKKKIHNVGIKWFLCDHENCNFKTNEKYQLNKHKQRIHNLNTKWFCCDHENCDYKTKNKYYLKIHKQRIHDISEKLKCDNCDYEAKSKIEMKNHILYYHSPDAPIFYCNEKDCTYNSKVKWYLQLHKKHTHDIGNKECVFCTKLCFKLLPYKDTEGNHKICKLCFKKVTGYKNRIEKTVVEFLRKSYNHPIISHDKTIKGETCTKYRPDVLYTSPNRIVVVEIDEHQHKWNNGSYLCEEQRMLEIQEEFGGIQTIFVRFNPDNYNVQNKKSLNLRLKFLIDFLQELESTNIENIIKVYYLFYDTDNPRISKNIKHELIQ